MSATQPIIHARYQVQTLLGKGGMGEVYRAFDRLTRQTVAIKQVLAEPAHLQHNSQSDAPLLALANEFRVLAGLRHPHIVSVLDYGFDAQRRPFYTMELIEEARTLSDFVDETLSTKTRLALEMLQALVYLHRRGILHRDLKPSNVLVTITGEVRVMDFGLALYQTEMPETDEMVGTMAYIAPELWTGDAPSVMSDLYAVGIILYELFTGNHPFTTDDGNFSYTTMLSKPVNTTDLPAEWVAVIDCLLEKSPDMRYPSAQAVINAIQGQLNLVVTTESQALRESFLQAAAFVGRDSEFTTLQDALIAMLAGKSQMWLIGGESGSGKSRLLDELRPRALTQGAMVLRGQALAEGGLLYQLWRETARSLILQVTLSDLEASILKPLIPDIAVLLERPVADVPELLGIAGQERLALTLIELLKRYTEPLVLLLEDLHWAEENLFILQKIIAMLDQLPPLLIVGTYRNDERPTLPEALAGAQVLALGRLDETAMQALAQSMLGEAGKKREIIALLRRETEGNVFFMVETVRVLAEEAGTLSAIGETNLPVSILAGGIQQLVQRRLNRVPAVYRSLLEHLAVVGRLIDETILKHLAKDSDITSFLQAGADTAVLEFADGVWRFAHDKLREGLLRVLPADTLVTRHRAVAEAIEACYPNIVAYHEALMEHWGKAGDHAKELDYLLLVVKNLVNVRAEYTRADTLIKRGLYLLENSEDARLATLYNWQSDNYRQQGDYPNAIHSAEVSRALAERLGLPSEVAHSHNLRGRVALDQGDTATARESLAQSLMLYRQLDDQQGMSSSLNYLGNIAFFQGDYTTATAHYEQSIAFAREIGDQQRMGGMLNNLGNLAITQGNLIAAREYYQQSFESSRQIGDQQRIVVILNNLGIVAYFQADYPTARDYYQQSGTLARQIGDRLGIARSLNNLAELAFERDTDDLLGVLAEGLALNLDIHAYPNTIQMLLVVGRLATQQRQLADAARIVGLLSAHPATGNDAKQPLEALRHELEAQLPADEFATLLAEGATLDLEATARTWLARIEATMR